MPAPRFIVYTRSDCGLCEEFIAQFAALGLPFDVLDVDDDPLTRRRFGHKVPVLTCDGSVVCHGRLEPGAALRLARS